ncbi:UMP kinase [Candidatus Woesearchaeota archaeon]|nr:UMP kinase [Candidatus Woesearchaeota archaeon]
MKKIVISLGGSLINPGKINYKFLRGFKATIRKFFRYKIVIVTGGGKIARDYIEALSDKNEKIRSLIGIKATKLNAMLVSNFLDNEIVVPDSLNDVKKLLKRRNLVVCGALGYRDKMTSDGTAADVARSLKADLLINMTNVKGLYDKDPGKFKNAKLISEIGFSNFLKIVNKIKYKPGQHFVLDQVAAGIIAKHKIKTVILKGHDELDRCLNQKKFIGTVIC